MTSTIDSVLNLVRPAVRREKAYHVGKIDRVEVKLNQNENPFDLPEALRAELAGIHSSSALNRYPSEFPDRLVKLLAESHKVDADGIIVGHGSNELSHFLGLCFIDVGTTAVLPRPMFALYETMVRLFGGEVDDVDCLDDFGFDADELIRRIEMRAPRLVIVANPNNPTGGVLGLEQIEKIVASSNGIVVIDEAYIEFTPAHSVVHLLDKYPNLIILRTLSKAFGLAGLRIGYMITNPALAAEMKKARLPFMVGRQDEECAIALLHHQDLITGWIRDIKVHTAWLVEQLTAIKGIETVPTHTNFFLFKTPIEAGVLADDLGHRRIAVRKMSSYRELQPYLRVCAGIPDENQRFVDALKTAVEQGGQLESA